MAEQLAHLQFDPATKSRGVRGDVKAILGCKRDLTNATARYGKEVCHGHCDGSRTSPADCRSALDPAMVMLAQEGLAAFRTVLKWCTAQ